jgi:hypothetical protein
MGVCSTRVPVELEEEFQSEKRVERNAKKFRWRAMGLASS